MKSKVWKAFSRWLHLRDPRRDLSSILEQADPAAPLQDQILLLADLAHWLRGGSLREETNRIVRLRFLFRVLDRQPQWKAALGTVVGNILRETEAPSLFAQTPLTEQGSFFMEILRRGVDRVLPPAPEPGELSYVVAMIFTDDDDLKWLESMSDEDWIYIRDMIQVGTETSLMRDLRDSIVKLSVQAAALGFASDVRTRLRDENFERAPSSPFLQLNLAAVRYREAQAADGEVRGAVRSCLSEVEGVYRRIPTSGISIGLVYRLETLTGLLRRLDLLAGFADFSPDDAVHWSTARSLVIEIVRTQLERRSIRALFGLNFDVFARKLIEHAGESGEHYITRTAREYFAMFRAAGGGGLITVVTTLAKFGIAGLSLPPFFEGLAYGLNYSVSFLAMQAFGFILATKQPSMTSATLAGHLSSGPDTTRVGEFVAIIAQITRSQFIAVLGNVILCALGSFIVDIAFVHATGHHPINASYAMHTIESFHPWHSLTLLYAAETGVLLWLSSFGAGWLQNWVIFRRLPEALGTHRFLQAVLGPRRARDLAESIRHNASGWGGNISIGLLLGFWPEVGKVFGLPFDVRHVTLTSGQLTFALRALPSETVTREMILTSVLGLAVIGLMNFSVSTACALFVAVRARRVRRSWFLRIMREVRRSFVRRPWPFFLPPTG